MTTVPLAFTRRRDGRMLAGIAGGFAEQHGVDVVVVRAALVILTFAGGLGLVLYALGAVLSEASPDTLPARHPIDPFRNLAVAAVTLGLVLIMRASGVWLGDQLMVTIIIVVSGIALLGAKRATNRDGTAGPQTSTLSDFVAGKHAGARIIAGALLIAVGLFIVAFRHDVAGGVRIGFIATALTIVGITILLGPWFARSAQQMAEDRRQRIRSEERERMAVHLHDSVLQTLALIQRNADDPRRTVTLARRQEQELREWLYGGGAASVGVLSGSVQQVAREVEDRYDVRVEVVVVGDAPMDSRNVALVAAMREACVNAAKHSGVDVLSVFVEVAEGAVDVFVRDRGQGFDPGSAATDRKGIAQSIEARLERVGGTATIDSEPGRGTEVHLLLPAASAEGRVHT